MTWDKVIALKRWIIVQILKRAGMKLTDSEKEEIRCFEDQIERYKVYKAIGMRCFVR